MAKNNNLTDFLTDVANAIREKDGSTGTINPQDFSDKIKAIQTGVDTSDGNIEPTTVLKGYKGYAKGVAVNGAIETYDGTVEDVSPQMYDDCLTFIGKESEFTLKATYKDWNGTLMWSTDHSSWTTLTGTEEMQSVDRKLYLRGKGNTLFSKTGFGVYWKLSAKADCTGNIQTLLDWENPPASVAKQCFFAMFKDCANLTSAPELPATTLADSCYKWMFKGCTKLKVNTSTGYKIFTCPSTIPNGAVTDMFTDTGGSFKGTPTAGNTYYWTE